MKRANMMLVDTVGVVHAGRTEKMNPYKKRFEVDTPLRTLEESLKGADYVVVMILAGGVAEFAQDYQIPMKYGVDNCIADTMGPGGVFRALRHIPKLLEIARMMREVCPNAVLFNYANPMAMCCWALGRVPGLQFVGLCHGVFMGMHQLAQLLEMPVEDLDTAACGMNHITFFQKVRHRGTGEDLGLFRQYPPGGGESSKPSQRASSHFFS